MESQSNNGELKNAFHFFPSIFMSSYFSTKSPEVNHNIWKVKPNEEAEKPQSQPGSLNPD